MSRDEKLAIDESERTARHQAVKEEVRHDVQAEIGQQDRVDDEHRRAQASAIGVRLREKAIDELAGTEAEIEKARVAARASQVVDYLFYAIYAVIGLEILLELLGARESNAFKNLIDTITAPLLSPFNTLIPDATSGRFQLKLSYIVALIVYLLLHLGINGLLRIMAHRKTAI